LGCCAEAFYREQHFRFLPSLHLENLAANHWRVPLQVTGESGWAMPCYV
jgi:hypothetical protein